MNIQFGAARIVLNQDSINSNREGAIKAYNAIKTAADIDKTFGQIPDSVVIKVNAGYYSDRSGQVEESLTICVDGSAPNNSFTLRLQPTEEEKKQAEGNFFGKAFLTRVYKNATQIAALRGLTDWAEVPFGNETVHPTHGPKM